MEPLKSMSQTDCDSYPPLFRPRTRIISGSPTDHHHHHHIAVDSDESFEQELQDFDPLPVIDLDRLNHKKLDEACREWGMFRLINHGIPATLVDHLHHHARKLFSLPYESKQVSFKPPMSYFWGTPGLTPSGVAIQSGSLAQNLNWIEGFHVLLTPLAQFHYEDPILDSFRCVLDEYGSHQTRLATVIFETLATNLQLDSVRTKSILSPETGHLRLHRYPRCVEADQQTKAWGIDVHTDSSILSILHQDDVGGLQLYNDQRWFEVKPQFDSLIVNLGDMMQAISNDVYIAAKHRVKVNEHKERISVGYFVLPYEQTVIESSKYKPFTYGDFRSEVQQDLKTVGYKIGLPKFRIE